MKSTTKIKLDLRKPNYAGKVSALQGDGNTRAVEAELLDGGKPWSVPEDITAAVIYCKPDGTKGFYNELADGTLALEASGSRVSLILARQMLTVPGTVQAGIIFNDRQLNQLTTFPFTVEVLPNPFTDAEASADYIRLQWLEEKLEERMRLAKESGEFDGKSPELLSHTVVYQVSDSGETPPAGQWLAEIPALSKGCWLWTRRTVHWSDHDPVTDYSVSYIGQDGQGRVISVAGLSPDSGGNVALDAGNVGALASSGGDITGEIRMNGQAISGLAAPVSATQAANKGYVDAGVSAAAPRNLLDNSDFTNLVAQAGIGGKHGTVTYAADRWILDSGTVSYTAGVGLTLNGTIKQRLEYTPSGETSAFVGMVSGTASIRREGGTVILTSSGGVLKWAALYEGSYTADTMPSYHPKGYGAELAECRYYFRRITSGHYFNGVATGSNKVASFQIYHDRKMRTTPTVTKSSDFAIVVYTQTGYSSSAPNEDPYGVPVSISCVNNADFAMNVQAGFNTSNVGSSNNTLIIVRIRTGYFDLSADM